MKTTEHSGRIRGVAARWPLLTLACVGLALAGVASLGGFGDCSGGSDDPCADDRTGCIDSNPDDFEIDETCTLTGPLEIEIGAGETSFSPLVDGEEPELEFGFQGGQHFFLGFRTGNADLTRYDELLVRYRAFRSGFEWDDACDPAYNPDLIVEGSGAAATPEDCWYLVAERELIVGREEPIQANADGQAEEYGWLVQIDWWPSDARRRLEVVVTDPCGRTGMDAEEYAAEAFEP